jgi:hypothetical protein
MSGHDHRQTYNVQDSIEGWSLRVATSLFVVRSLTGTQVVDVPWSPLGFWQDIYISTVALGASLTVRWPKGQSYATTGPITLPGLYRVGHFVEGEREIVQWGGGGAPGSLPAYSGNPSAVVVENTAGGPAVFRQLTWEDILDQLSVGLSSSVGVLEIGASTLPMSFSATYLRGSFDRTSDLVLATIQDDQGGALVDLLAQPDPNSFVYEPPAGTSYTKNTNNASVSFTLTAQDTSAVNPVAATHTVRWRPRVYAGSVLHPGAVAPPLTEALVEALPSQLLASRQTTISSSPGHNEHIYYAAPTAYGDPTFFIDGILPGGFQLVGDVTLTSNTANPVTQTYRVWRSDQDNLGPTVVDVQ